MLLAACGGGDEPTSGADAVVDTPQDDAAAGETSNAEASDGAAVDVESGDGESGNDEAGEGGATDVETADGEALDGESAADEPETEVPADGVATTVTDGKVNLVGAEVIDAANIVTNLLPDVVVDDLTNDRKVNFRNLVPQDKPILLWMYAPH
jgi:hypothetical protein